MYKIKICCVLFSILALSIICFTKFVELNDQENQKNILAKSRNSIDTLAEQINKFHFSYLKPRDRFFNKTYDLKKFIEKISKQLAIKKILMKTTHDFEEIKILVCEEEIIYDFTEALICELPGVVKFKSIKISKNNHEDFVAILQFQVCQLNEISNLIFINPINCKQKSINFFGAADIKPHRLFCTICNSKAYVDSLWFKVGDRINNYKLVNIGQNFIEIQEDNSEKISIKLGSSW